MQASPIMDDTRLPAQASAELVVAMNASAYGASPEQPGNLLFVHGYPC
jgi:hypothetical protein